MAKHAFEKFINKSASGAKKKEAIRQEKRKLKQEARKQGEALRDRNELRYGLSTSRGKKNYHRGKEAGHDVEDKQSRNSNPRFGKQETSDKFPGKTFKKQISGDKQSPARPYQKKQSSKLSAGTSPGHKQRKPVRPTYEQITQKQETGTREQETNQMPLNKFIAHTGICARREAAELVKAGKVQVNGSVIYEPGFKVTAQDRVLVKGKQVFLQKNLVYILLNKPKDYITTSKDPQGRKTVFDILKTVTKERIYPVGRLDRNTTGVLLMTNDGELAQKLTHPSYEIKKLYEVKLDRPLVKKDFEAVLHGVNLEDGFVKADALAYADVKDKSIVGIEIHSGRNRVVRRIFEHLGYDVKNLDRVMFGNLTKKNVDRGKWRYLSEKEVRLLKYMNQSFVRSKK